MSDTGMLGRLSGSLRKAWLRDSAQPGAGRGTPAAAGGSPDLLFLRARALARAGDAEMARKLYEDAAAADPTFADAVEAQGEMFDLAGQAGPAMEKYEASRGLRAAMRPGLPDRHFVQRQRGRFTVEILAYDSVVKSLKKNSLPYQARGNAYLASGRPEKALADYERALRLKPRTREILILKGEALSMLGRYDEALQIFDKALAIRADDAETLNCRAIARMALGRIQEANADWHRQFQLLPDRPAARACVALRMADYAAALPQLEGALLREPNDVYWHLYRLTAQRRLGIPVAAVPDLPVDSWPAPLFALHAGRLTVDEVMKQADTEGRRAEVLFQAGVIALAREPKAAEGYWRQVVELAAPSLVEYAAARNELSRLGS